MGDNAAKQPQSDRFIDDSPARGDDSVDLRAIAISLRKYKWPIILTTALCSAATAVIVSGMTPVYRSTATLLFDQEQQQTIFDPTNGLGTQEEIQTQVEILKSRTIAERVVDEFNLAEHWEYNKDLEVPEEYQYKGPLAPVKAVLQNMLPGGASVQVADESFKRDQIVRQLMGQTTVTALKQTNLVRVNVEGADRELATDIANGIGRSYIDFFIEQSNLENKAAKEFLQTKVDELKVKLEQSEQALLDARRTAGISGDGGDFANQTIALFRNRLVDAKTQLEIARIQWQEVQRAGGSIGGSDVTFGVVGIDDTSNYRYVGTGYEVLPVVDSNALVQRDKERMQEAKRVLGELSNRYGEKHPRVIDARSNYQTALGNLDRQISNVVSSVEKQFLAARGQVQSLEADIRREEGKAYRLSEGRVQTKELELERDSNKTYYEEAVAELRGYQEENLDSVPMSITDPASVPLIPVKPKKTLLVMLGFLLSLFSISAILYAFENMKETVRGIQDVEKKLGIPVFGIVPVLRNGLMGKRSIPLVPGEFDDHRGSFAEAIRTIRTSATMSELDQPHQVIMVTSSVPSEGKSTFASNLAHSLSKLENTVLIEADMRRPGLGRALGIKSNGLSDLLEGNAYLEDCMRLNAIEELDLIPAGRIPKNHLELLASPEFAELMTLLKERYDRIVIDLAPVQAVSDAIVVGKYADAAIYVVKADSTPLPVIKRGLNRLQEVGINVAGAVISQVDIAKLASYGGDYYYQGYYDYYGYGETTKPSGLPRRSISRGDTEFENRQRARQARRSAKNVSQLRRRDGDDHDDRLTS